MTRVIAREPRPEALYALGVAWWHRGDAARATAAFQATIAAGAASRGGPSRLGASGRPSVTGRGGRGTAPRTRVATGRSGRARHAGAACCARRATIPAPVPPGRRRATAARVRTRTRSAGLDVARQCTTGARRSHCRAGCLPARPRDPDTYAPAHFQMGRALERLGDAEAADGAYARARHSILTSSAAPARSGRVP